MNAVLWWLTQNTIIVMVMIPFVLLACRLCRNRPAVQHVLWTIVLVKFITPPIVSWPWTVEEVRDRIFASRVTPANAPPAAGGAAEESPAHETLVTNEADEKTAAALVRLPLEQPAGGLPREKVDSATLGTALVRVASGRTDIVGCTLGLATVIWIVGAVVFAVWQSRRLARHAALVRGGIPAPTHLTDEIRALSTCLGFRPPRAVLAAGVLSPFMWCLGRLCLVWPKAMASRPEVARARGVIAHELAHIRRRDHWVAWLELVAGVVWWWNPLFWFVRRRMREAAEAACDALAISTCPQRRREYAELLLELSAGCKTGAPEPVLGVGAGTPSSFERRLSMILSDRVSGKVSLSGMLLAVGFALLTLPGWSLGQPREPEREERAAPESQPAEEHAQLPPQCREALNRELPAACLRAVPEDRPVTSDACMKCHTRQSIVTGVSSMPSATCMTCHTQQGLVGKGNWKHSYEGKAEPDRKWTHSYGGAAGEKGMADYHRIAALELENQQLGEALVAVGAALGRVTTPANVERSKGAPTWAWEPIPGKSIRFFQGNGRTYYLKADKNHTYLSSLSDVNGKLIWRSAFGESVPVSDPRGRWTLEEAADGKEITLTWSGDGLGSARYTFDKNTGRVVRREVVTDPPRPVREAPQAKGMAAEFREAALEVAKERKLKAEEGFKQLLKEINASGPNDRQITQQELDAAKAKLREAEAKLKEAELAVQHDAKSTRKLAPAANIEVKVFTLRYAKAPEVSRSLKDLFPEKDGWSLRITANEGTNSLLVRGTEKDLKAANKVIELLEKMSNK